MSRTPEALFGAYTPPGISREAIASRLDIAPGGFEFISVSDQDTPTTAEIINSSDTETASMPEDPLALKKAASLRSPTQARHYGEHFSKTHVNFEDKSLSSELSSPSTDLETTHSQSESAPPHSTGQRADKMGPRPRPRSGDMAPGETMQSYYNDIFLPDLTPEAMGHIVEMGRNSPGSRLPESWIEPPVGYVPASWPTGPRNLPPGRYTCPYIGCKHPVGPKEWSQGYSRTNLGPHILSHGVFDGVYDLRSTVRGRVMAMRQAQGRNTDHMLALFNYSDDEADGLQLEIDDLIVDLEELKDWEESSRHVGPPRAGTAAARLMTQDEILRYSLRDEKPPQQGEAAEQADDESVPRQSSNRLRNNRTRRPRGTSSAMHREEEARSPLLLAERPKRPSSPQEMETDSSHSPPRKKARRVQPQLQGSREDPAPGGG